ncbi:MAG: SDR family oxidoreductase [Alphaproteobacteria bacterium]|nr:SDR family oxidoreductase [Alphaproteobacteria bacterium]
MRGKHAIVTGVASGIGAEVAKMISAAGATVTGLDIVETQDNVDRFIELDLSDPKSIETAAKAIDGNIDILCNVAGLPPRDGLEGRILAVNFIGTRHFTNALMDQLVDGATIVNVASRAGAFWRDNIEQVKSLLALGDDTDTHVFCAENEINSIRAYNLSKEAIVAWTLAETETHVARGIRANTVSPGAVATGILDDFLAAFGEQATRNIARVGRPASAEDVAKVVLFLAGPGSQWLRGVDIPIDGGMGALNVSDMLGLT